MEVLTLTSPWQKEQLVLLRPTDAARLCCEGGYEELSWRQATLYISDFGQRNVGAARVFLARIRLTSLPPAMLDGPNLLALLSNSVRSRNLVALRRCEAKPSGRSDPKVEDRRLVRDIAAQTHRSLSYSGRQYRLVSDADLGKLADRDGYEVVQRSEAVQILDALAKQAGPEGAALAALLTRAQARLTRDWCRPFRPDGLVLLRRLSHVQAVAPSTEPAITPSQMRRLLRKTDWIEIEVVYEDGEPYHGPYRLELPDARVLAGDFAQDGFYGNYDIDPGKCDLHIGKSALPKAPDQSAEEARRVRLVGMLFDTNKTFLLPHGLAGIRTIVAMHREHPLAEILLVGHASADEAQAQPGIALARAEILKAYLLNEPEAWLKWFDRKIPRSVRWGLREVQLMLSALPEGDEAFYQGYASGVSDEKTRQAIRKFQSFCNATKKAKLTVDGVAGPATYGQLVRAYMAIEDTSLTEDVFAVAHGCEGHFDDSLTENGLQPDDRRLEAFFFENGICPRPRGSTSSPGSAEYPAWRSRLAETRDFEQHCIHIQVIDKRKQPVPFATVRLAGPTKQDGTSDEHGFVSFFGLSAGEYSVRSERKGYGIGESKIRYPTSTTFPAMCAGQ